MPKPAPVSERVKEIMMEMQVFSPYEVYKQIRGELKDKYKHVTEYPAFYYRYIFAPHKLGLIERVEGKKPRKGERKRGFKKSYYRVVNPDSPMWENPLKYYNPLTSLGRRRYNILKEEAEAEGISVVDALFNKYPGLVKEVAEARGIKVSQLKAWLKRRSKV